MSSDRILPGGIEQICPPQSIVDDIAQTESRFAHDYDLDEIVPENVTSQVEEGTRHRCTGASGTEAINEQSTEGVIEAAAPSMLDRHRMRSTTPSHAQCETAPDARHVFDNAELSLALDAFANSSRVEPSQGTDPAPASSLPAFHNDACSDAPAEAPDTPLVATAFFEIAGWVSVATERLDELDMDFEEEVIALYQDTGHVEDIAIDIERLTNIYDCRRNEISDALCFAQGQLQLRLEACRRDGVDPEDYRYRRCFDDAI